MEIYMDLRKKKEDGEWNEIRDENKEWNKITAEGFTLKNVMIYMPSKNEREQNQVCYSLR